MVLPSISDQKDLISDSAEEVYLYEELDREFSVKRGEYQPWTINSEQCVMEQRCIHAILKKRAGAKHIGAGVYIARNANIFTHFFAIGNFSWVAAGAILRGHVEIGENTTVNPYAHIAGDVRIGSGTRIAGGVSIYGFNHGHNDASIPIYRQSHTSVGVRIGDDCWIGANAVIVDGVKVGSHSIIAGGAVVTKSVPEFSIVGGNPSKIIRDRREGA